MAYDPGQDEDDGGPRPVRLGDIPDDDPSGQWEGGQTISAAMFRTSAYSSPWDDLSDEEAYRSARQESEERARQKAEAASRRKALSEQEATSKYEALCARSECCRSDLYKKLLRDLGGDTAAADRILDHLEREGFLDEGRYARAFARDKSSLTGWGRAKISTALRMKGVSREAIDSALGDIEEESAGRKLDTLLRRKYQSLKDDPMVRYKLTEFALRRGYLYEEVRDRVEGILSGDDEGDPSGSGD